MHYLIDGHNLIAKLPDIDLNDPNDEIELILRLKSWAAASNKRKVTVYFDGGLPGGVEQRLSTSAIKVIFAPEGKTADSLIIKRIRKIQNPPEHTLVTSDQQIIAASKKRRLPYLRSEKFATQMGRDKQTRQAPPPASEIDDPQLSQGEVAEWLAIFGTEPKIAPKPKPTNRNRPTESNPKRAKPRRSPQELKTAANNLNEDEITEWLDLFTQH